MANKKQTEGKDPEVMIESAIGRTEAWIMSHGRQLLIALGVAVVLVGGFYGFKYLVAAPRAEKAAAMMYVAQQQFAQDSLDLALNGDGNYAGFLEVIDTYGSTPEGNLARHYAGVCYLKKGDYEQALHYFGAFKPVKGVPGSLISAQNFGLQGDAYSQLKDYEKAASMYERAAQTSENTLTAPYYLKKAGLVYETLGNHARALAVYEKIRTDYASSMEARDIQKYIGGAEQF